MISDNENLCILTNGKYFFVSKDSYETRESLLDRAWYISKKSQNNPAEYLSAVNSSRILRNKKIYKCGYNVENNIKTDVHDN